MKQREAVYQATHGVLNEQGIAFEDHSDINSVMTPELRKQIIAVVTEGIEAGNVDFSEAAHAKYPDTPAKRKYVSGLVSNWFRKDKRFNGNTTYTPANPGSRTGSSDPEIKNLKLLLKSGRLNDDQAAKVQSRIDEKTAELRAAKNTVEVDMTAIPSELLESLGIDSE